MRIKCHTPLILFMMVGLAAFVSGCMSATIISSGKSYPREIARAKTVEEARKFLGPPAWSQPCIPPKHFTSEESEPAQHLVATLFEVYTRQGPYAVPLRGEAYAMLGALTFGVADILLLPVAIHDRLRMSKLYYSITIWFDEQGRYVTSCQGDVTDVDPDINWNNGLQQPKVR